MVLESLSNCGMHQNKVSPVNLKKVPLLTHLCFEKMATILPTLEDTLDFISPEQCVYMQLLKRIIEESKHKLGKETDVSKDKFATSMFTSSPNEVEPRVEMFSSCQPSFKFQKRSSSVEAENYLENHLSNSRVQDNNLVDVRVVLSTDCLELQSSNFSEDYIKHNHPVVESKRPEIEDAHSNHNKDSQTLEVVNTSLEMNCPKLIEDNSSKECVQEHPVEVFGISKDSSLLEMQKDLSLEEGIDCLELRNTSFGDGVQPINPVVLERNHPEIDAHYLNLCDQDDQPIEVVTALLEMNCPKLIEDNSSKECVQEHPVEVVEISKDFSCSEMQDLSVEGNVELGHPAEPDNSMEDIDYANVTDLIKGNEESSSCTKKQKLSSGAKIAKTVLNILADVRRNLLIKESNINNLKVEMETDLEEMSSFFNSFNNIEMNSDFCKLQNSATLMVDEYDKLLVDIRNDNDQCEWYSRNIQEMLEE